MSDGGSKLIAADESKTERLTSLIEERLKDYGLDLSSYSHVKTKAQSIYATLVDGSMPCDGAWPRAQIDVFGRWAEGGRRP